MPRGLRTSPRAERVVASRTLRNGVELVCICFNVGTFRRVCRRWERVSRERLGNVLSKSNDEREQGGETTAIRGVVTPPQPEDGAGHDPDSEAVDFVRFCYRRRAVAWPERAEVVKFGDRARAETMLEFGAEIDSIAFGQAGTRIEGLLFVTHNTGDAIITGNAESEDGELTMPSVVAFPAPGVVSIGAEARERMASQAQWTVASPKRLYVTAGRGGPIVFNRADGRRLAHGRWVAARFGVAVHSLQHLKSINVPAIRGSERSGDMTSALLETKILVQGPHYFQGKGVVGLVAIANYLSRA